MIVDFVSEHYVAVPLAVVCVVVGAIVKDLVVGVIRYYVYTKPIAERKYLSKLPRMPDFSLFMQLKDGGVEEFVRTASSNGTGADFTGHELVNLSGYFDGTLSVGVCSAEGLRQVLLNHENDKFMKHPGGYDILKPLLGNGLVLSNGEVWHRERKLLTPLFHLKRLRSYNSIINEESRLLCERFEREGNAGAQALHVAPMFGDTTQTIAMKAVFGNGRLDFEQSTLAWTKITESLFVMFTALSFFPQWFLRLLPGPTSTFYREMAKVEASMLGAIRAAREEKLPADDMIGMMAQLRDEDGSFSIPEDLILAEAKTINFAARDTSSNTLAWTLCFLCQRPKIQEELKAEVDKVIGNDADISEDQLKSLKLTTAAIRETLRLRPPAPTLDRIVMHPGGIELCGTHLPQGTAVTVFNIGVNWSSCHWGADSLEYRPARHLEDCERHPFAFSSFSVGGRNCIGQKLAMQETVAILAHLVRRFRFECADAASIKSGFAGTLEPRNFNVHCVPRE